MTPEIPERERERDKETERERQRQRDRDRERDRETKRGSERDIYNMYQILTLELTTCQ